ncbi:hypothetical protein EYB26_001211 [Talaromyces marneffei]|uniref:uncharacterized protein n=1 Tax=Talaromyces marneffei TaxID=37727 RepID=UPI0012A8FA16|nr:uncharacterized protein EYB26_001211 [Talaromyces marneffei]QGA13561.1 hypothetical protein EYB26_001211 [Talaromyces marneffei]
MARFNYFYYLFAVFAVLALVANARPTSTQPNTGSVAGMPGMAAEFGNANSGTDKTQDKTSSSDAESAYLSEMERAIEAFEMAASASAGASRPTPGVPTTVLTSARNMASPSASAAAKPKSMLSNLPLVGGLVGGLPF